MTDATETPAAPPAAPAASGTPAASTPAETPATPATPPAAAAPAAPTSLLPAADAVAAIPPAAETPAAPATPPPAVNQEPAEWFLAPGVKGAGPAPAWYRADKYKTLADQAEAQFHSEKRFGAFVGAPKDGRYEIKLPEGIQGEFDMEHPLLQGFQTWAVENQLSQEGYNAILGMFAQYEAAQAPDMGEIKKQLGERADERIGTVATWAKANFPAETYEVFREATSGPNAAAVFKAMEAVIAKTRQVAMPKVGDDARGGGNTTEADINAMQAKRGPDGRRLYETDPKYRAEVEKRRTEFYAGRQKAA